MLFLPAQHYPGNDTQRRNDRNHVYPPYTLLGAFSEACIVVMLLEIMPKAHSLLLCSIVYITLQSIQVRKDFGGGGFNWASFKIRSV